MGVDKCHREECIIMPRVIVFGPCGKFLISRHERRGNIVSKKMRFGIGVQELDDIVMPDDASTACLWKSFRWNDLPVVVGITVTISCNLLT